MALPGLRDPVRVDQNAHKAANICLHCRRLLREAHQTDDGVRLCKTCLHEILRKPGGTCECCSVTVENGKYYPDKAAQREVNKLTVICCYQRLGCPWQDQFQLYEAHAKSCDYRDIQCMLCGQHIQLLSLSAHKERECPMRPQQCTYCRDEVPAQKMTAHLEKVCPEILRSCPNRCDPKLKVKLPELQAHLHATKGDCPHTEIKCPYNEYGCSFVEAKKRREARKQTVHTTHERVNSQRQRITAIEHNFEGLANEYANIQRMTPATVSEIQTATSSHNSGSDHSLDRSLSSSLDQELRLQLLERATYNGILIWKIDNFSRRRQEAVDGKTLSLYSTPFYTSRPGYKMFARVYLNGDGLGKETHLSFFFVVMRGPFDALLTWPFKQKVTLSLINQSGKKHVTGSFRPDPQSSSFQRPGRKEMNVASGCPMFIRVEHLLNGGFVKDDSIFLKVVVDTSDLPNLVHF